MWPKDARTDCFSCTRIKTSSTSLSHLSHKIPSFHLFVPIVSALFLFKNASNSRTMRRASAKLSSILSKFEQNSDSQFDLLRWASSSSHSTRTARRASIDGSAHSTSSQGLLTQKSFHGRPADVNEHTDRGGSLSGRMLASWYDSDDDDSDDEIDIEEIPSTRIALRPSSTIFNRRTSVDNSIQKPSTRISLRPPSIVDKKEYA